MVKLYIQHSIGANGFTVKLQNTDFIVTYSHVSPIFLVSVGDFVKQGEIIAQVGPKYINNVPNNPYKDSTGRTTNGATTGPHLHFSIKKGNEYVNPLDYLTKKD